MLLINDHAVKILKTQPVSVVLKSNGYSVNDEKHSVYVDGTKYAPETLRHAFVRKDGNHVIEIRKDESDD